MRRLSAVLSGLVVLAATLTATVTAGATPAAATGHQVPTTGAAGSFHPVTSVRVLDTRKTAGLAPGATTRVVVSSRTIPAGAAAVTVNLTVLAATRAGSIAVFAGDTDWNGSASISFAAGQVKQNMITSKLGADGSLAVRNNTAVPLQVIGDVAGYYAGGTPSANGTFAAIPLQRVFDTRAAGSHALAPGSVTRMPLTGAGAIPSGAGAVLANLTVISPGAAGSVSTWASDASWDGSAAVSFAAARSEQDVLAVTVGPDGAAMIRNNAAVPVQVVLDAIGYFLGGTPDGEGAYLPTSPTRVFDSRLESLNNLPLDPGQQMYVNTGKGAVPNLGVPALVARFTVLSPSRAGSISVFPGDAAWNGAASISFGAGTSVQQQLTVVPDPTGQNWQLRNNSAVPVSVVVDVLGYYLGVPNPLRFADSGQFVDPYRGRLSAISCVGTFCMVVSDHGYVQTGNGSGWSSPAKVGLVDGLYSVACASASFCLAGGMTGRQGSVLRYDGTNWTVALAPAGSIGTPPQVSCASTGYCVATYSSYARTFNGTSWSAAAPIGGVLARLSCPVAGFCMGATSGPQTFRLAGGRWTPVPISTNPSALTCLSSTFCLAATGQDVLRYDGTAWSAISGLTWTGPVVGLACASTTDCHAASVNGDVYDYDGASWSAPTELIRDGGGPISCTSAGRCTVIDMVHHAIAATFDGASWGTPQFVDLLPGELDGVSCVSASFCVAVDSGGYALRFDGTSWTARAQVAGGNGLTGASCVSTTFCIAVDDAGQALGFDGTSWTSPTDVVPGMGLVAVSCASTTFCAALADDGTVVRYDGTTWSAPTAAVYGNPVGISCPTASFCAAVDSLGHVATWDGTGWNGPSWPGSEIATGIACGSASSCVLSSTFFPATWDGTGWTVMSQPSARDLAAASCPAADACGVMGSDGTVRFWDGSQLSMPAPGGSLPTSDGAAISCPTASFCMVVEGSDTAYRVTT